MLTSRIRSVTAAAAARVRKAFDVGPWKNRCSPEVTRSKPSSSARRAAPGTSAGSGAPPSISPAFTRGPLRRTAPSGAPAGMTRHSTVPWATVSPAAACSPVTRPGCGARSGFSIFIASTTSSSWPAATSSPSATATRSTVPCMGALMMSPAAWPARS